jgi:hypothetical protein
LWLQKLSEINCESAKAVFDEVPVAVMTDMAKQFAFEMLRRELAGRQFPCRPHRRCRRHDNRHARARELLAQTGG